MRIAFIIFTCIAILLGFAFVVLPMGSIALLPPLIGLFFAYLALRNSEKGYKNPPKILMTITSFLILVGIYKHFFVAAEIAKDDSFEVRVEDSQKEAIEELNSIEEE